MRNWLLLAAVGLAISFIFAEEKQDVQTFPFKPIPAGPPLVQQIEAINQKFDEGPLRGRAPSMGNVERWRGWP